MDDVINRVDPQDVTISELRDKIEALERYTQKLEAMICREEDEDRYEKYPLESP
jgi:hypothetical protein